jgi:hypothetical protein
LTVVCPPVEAADEAVLWTSRDWPVMEATVPKAPGGVAGRPEPAAVEEVELLELAAVDPPPQAARARAAPPRMVSTHSRLARGARPPGVVGPDVGNGVGFFIVDAP